MKFPFWVKLSSAGEWKVLDSSGIVIAVATSEGRANFIATSMNRRGKNAIKAVP